MILKPSQEQSENRKLGADALASSTMFIFSHKVLWACSLANNVFSFYSSPHRATQIDEFI